MAERAGPECEQLNLGEDIDRLCDIGDFVLAGYAELADFDLTHREQLFVKGYLGGAIGDEE